MIKGRQLTGIEVIDREKGKIAGRVKNVLFKPGSKVISGFSINSDKWSIKDKAVLIKDVACIGRDAVLVNRWESIFDIRNSTDLCDMINKKNSLYGLMVITEKGEEIGYIDDILINERNFNIEGYVITDGIIEDIINGKSIISSWDNIRFGDDAAIIDDEYKNYILRNDISLKKIFQKYQK